MQYHMFRAMPKSQNHRSHEFWHLPCILVFAVIFYMCCNFVSNSINGYVKQYKLNVKWQLSFIWSHDIVYF